MNYKPNFMMKHKSTYLTFLIFISIILVPFETKSSLHYDLRNLLNTENYTIKIDNETLKEINNQTLIKKLYEEDGCSKLISDYHSQHKYFLYFPNNDYTYSLLNRFFYVNEESTQEIKRYITNITSYDSINSSHLDLLIFLESFIFLVIFISTTIIFVIICCFCSCYDYCPIICAISRKNEKNYRLLSFIINLFSGINLIVPCIFSIYNF